MKDTKYKSREYKSEAIIKTASEDIKVMAQSLLPEGYSIHIDDCDRESENQFSRRYNYQAKIEPDYDAPHFIVYSCTKDGVYAKVVEFLFSKPIYPLVR